MRIFGRLLLILCCLSVVGCHHSRHSRHRRGCLFGHRHHACVDRHEWDNGDDCDHHWDDDWNDDCERRGRRHSDCPPYGYGQPMMHDYGHPPANYGFPGGSECGCETSAPPILNGTHYGHLTGNPMTYGVPATPGCSTCGTSPTFAPQYPFTPTQPTFTPQGLNQSSVPTPAPASEYYNPQPTPAAPTTPTLSNPDSAALPKLGTPTQF